jgi:hypothetical protein
LIGHPVLSLRVRKLERRVDDHDTAIETLTVRLNETRIGVAWIMKNLGVLMASQGVRTVELSEDEADALFD